MFNEGNAKRKNIWGLIPILDVFSKNWAESMLTKCLIRNHTEGSGVPLLYHQFLWGEDFTLHSVK